MNSYPATRLDKLRQIDLGFNKLQFLGGKLRKLTKKTKSISLYPNRANKNLKGKAFKP
jgi:hypothetical protein